jgi:hypothetical protein
LKQEQEKSLCFKYVLVAGVDDAVKEESAEENI